GDLKQWGPGRPALPEAYYPLQILLPWWDDSGISLVVKTSQSPAAVLGPVRNTIHDLDKTMALFDVRTMEEVVSDSMRLTNIQMYLFGSFAGLAVFLAAIGMYSVLAYLVTQRTREIGIRVALGAQRRNVLRLVVGHGAKLVLVGVILGVLAAWGVTRIIAGLLYGVSATDPLTFAGVVVVLTVVALVACLVPASRAMSVDPMVALRHE
ncbi:MAG TPA: FtsX-like permease family protein, partial [Alphaproteobacteria bacterium]|nr:FtsX-like permease family protein [Alphaproteobacteria bacterium]